MPTPALASFNDTEQLSIALAHTDVRAMQLNEGAFGAHLSQQQIDGWTLQFLEFVDGVSTCAGSAPADRAAFVVPLTVGDKCRLLGSPLEETVIGIYAPGSEHADVSASGLSEVVLTPPAELLEEALGRGEEFSLPAEGSLLRTIPGAELAALRRMLSSAVAHGPQIVAHSAAARGLTSDLEVVLLSALSAADETPAIGRLPRRAILRRVNELLQDDEVEPIHASDLVRLTGVSYPTLRRVFLEWFGTTPINYLQMKRLYLARRRLQSGAHEKVSDVAMSCAFWELGRFAQRYREVFGELPSETLKAATERECPARRVGFFTR
ncbi:MAG: helix-turn-helix domain-containing protein [Roseovarius sp.]